MFHSSDYLDRCRQAERYDDYLDREPEEDAFLDDRSEDYFESREEQE